MTPDIGTSSTTVLGTKTMTEDDIEQALLLLRFWYKLSTDPQFSMDNPWEIRRDYELQTDEFLSKHERQEAEPYGYNRIP